MFDGLTGLLAIVTGLIALLLPVFILMVIFTYARRSEKQKYDAMVEISKNIEDQEDIKNLLETFNEKKKPIDYRRSGVVTFFVGGGIYLLGNTIQGMFLEGSGFLIAAIGVGLLLAGYLYPNESEEINKAVESFEKR